MTILRPERHDKIIQLIKERGIISTADLCSIINASKATIRRDITELDEAKQIKKTHGGAMVVTKPATEELPISLRRFMQKDEKVRIATAALESIKDGDTIFLDSGTTTFELAAKLNAFRHLTVLTNDINIAVEVASNSENGLIVAGGVLKKKTATLMGMFTEQMLSELHVDKAFLAADAINIESGYMDYNTAEIPIKRIMIKNSRERIMLCDHSKFQNAAFMSICPIHAIGLTITGKEINPDIVQKMQDSGVIVKVV